MQHPYYRQPSIDPFLARCLQVASLPSDEVAQVRLQRLAMWSAVSRTGDSEKQAWLQELPQHSRKLYGSTGFNGPLFAKMHRYMVSLGYPDKHLWRDVCKGFPTGCVLPDTGLWSRSADADQACARRGSTDQIFEKSPEMVKSWLKHRKPDSELSSLLKRNEKEVQRGSRVEVCLSSLRDGSFVAHPEFTVKGGRACDDVSVSGWNDTTVSKERLALPSADDVVDYSSRLLEQDPLADPLLAVADEDAAYRNWANGWPSAMIMLVLLGNRQVRAFKDYALCFGDKAFVYAYNRLRTFITSFCRVEFAIAAWSYFDDTAVVDRRMTMFNAWYVFLQLHFLLVVPIKGNPLVHSEQGPERKYLPPAPSNRFLGEKVYVNSLPCTVAPTPSRKESGKELLAQALARDELLQSLASSVFSKLRFLGTELHGKCGIPALQALLSHEKAPTPKLGAALRSALLWLSELLEGAGPREWPWGAAASHTLHIFGDASEPGCTSNYRPQLGAVLVLPDSSLQAFSVEVPQSVIDLLPTQKKIYYLELLWPVLAVYIWHRLLHQAYVVVYDDNEGAKFNLLRGFSNDFTSALFLAVFWGAAAAQKSRPWIARVDSKDNPADCLTKPGLDMQHLRGAWHVPDEQIGDFWTFLIPLLQSQSFPKWASFEQAFCQPVQ